MCDNQQSNSYVCLAEAVSSKVFERYVHITFLTGRLRVTRLLCVPFLRTHNCKVVGQRQLSLGVGLPNLRDELHHCGVIVGGMMDDGQARLQLLQDSTRLPWASMALWGPRNRQGNGVKRQACVRLGYKLDLKEQFMATLAA
jgi:hypothetical protein